MTQLTFIDIETTGLYPSIHEIISIAAVRGDESCYVKIEPAQLYTAERVALEINGYLPTWGTVNFGQYCNVMGLTCDQGLNLINANSENLWCGVSIQEGLATIKPFLSNTRLAGHNVGFDYAFLAEAWRKYGYKPEGLKHRVVDTQTMAFLAGYDGGLADVCKALDIPLENHHDALADAIVSREIFRRLQKDVSDIDEVFDYFVRSSVDDCGDSSCPDGVACDRGCFAAKVAKKVRRAQLVR